MPNALASPTLPDNTFETLVDAASNHLQAGRLEEARKACRDLSEDHPDQPNTWFLYGLSALQSGDATAAIPALERAVAMHQANAAYRRMLSRALRAAGRKDDAIAALEHALALEPGHPEALLTLGLLQIEQGRKESGVALCRRGIALGLKDKWRKAYRNFFQRFAPVLALLRRSGSLDLSVAMNRGTICEWLGDTDMALQHYQDAIDFDPENTTALTAAGRLLNAKEDHLSAVDLLERAARRDTETVSLQIDLAVALNGTQRFAEATEVLERLFARGIETPRALLTYGRAQTGAGDAKAAEGSYRKALSLAPNSAEAHFALGRNRQEAGKTDEANRLFFETLEIDRNHCNAYRFLASNKAFGVEDAAFENMIALLESGKIAPAQRLRLHFAAAAIYEQAGDTDQAFAHLSAGNGLKNVVFDPDCCADYFGKLIETFDAPFFERVRSWGNQDGRPVFIVGMPRSGTTLVEQILASHPDMFGAGELESFNFFVNGLSERLQSEQSYPDCVAQLDRATVESMAAEHVAALRDLSADARLVTDKMPTNFLHVGLILTLFPNAQIVHCNRDPRDTCFSIFGLDFAGEHAYAYDQINLGRYYRQYERLMAHWRRIAPDSILDVRYEDMVADQETETRRLLAFCGLDWDVSCLDFHKTDRTVRTWSYNQVRQPIYKSSVARWRKFEAHLAPLLAELDVRDAPAPEET